MAVHFRVPRGPLSDFVELLWLFDPYAVPHARERLLPGATTELVIDLRSAARGSAAALVAGPRSEYFVLNTSEAASLLGAHFKPGGGGLAGIAWRDGATEVAKPVRHLFAFIGADPNTGWLRSCSIALDDRGFVLTGQRAGARSLETSVPGIFAIGDVRSGSTKRVAAAVGEGAAVVGQLHALLATT